MHIVYVSDGKAGHRSQAVGLYQAMQRAIASPITFQEISINDLPFINLIQGAVSKKNHAVQKPPDYILGVGSHTQLKVLLLGKIFPVAETVILMKPNFPFGWFDHVIVPEHDGVPEQGNVMVTQGALNPIVNEQRHQSNRILIALGGSSKRHQWNDAKVLQAVQRIAEQNAEAEIILTTSRRTPKDFLTHLKQQSFAQQLQIFPVEETPQGWIFEEMQKAEAVWVTEDSVSMIFEALTAGCKVGVILIDRLKDDRVVNAVNNLLQLQRVSSSHVRNELPEGSVFAEADRAAQRLLQQR